MEIQQPNMIMSEPKRSPIGPVIGLIIILAIIIIGGLYFWGERVGTREIREDMMPTTLETDATQENNSIPTQESLQEQSSSDELDAIEADLNATNFTNIDAGIEEIQ